MGLYNIKQYLILSIMKSKTATWFETKVRYERVGEDGGMVKATEVYAVDAISFGEAENRVLEELNKFTSSEVEVVGISIANYKEVFISDDANADKWYKAKLAFITIDEKTQKEKRNNVYYLVNASSINAAIRSIDEVMGGTMVDYNSLSVTETQVMDIIQYIPKKKEEEK